MNTIETKVGQLGIRYLIDGSRDAGLGMFELTVPPGSNVPPPHSHTHNEEIVYVLEGTLRYAVGSDTRDLTPGQTMRTPKGSVHGFSNPFGTVARALITLAPDIGPQYFEDIAAIVNAGGPPDKAALVAVMGRYGLVPAAPGTAPAAFDAAQYKNAQREQWNKDGAAWRRWSPTLDRCYGEVTRQMLDLARIQPGQRVLDVAAGAGEPAVSAAERVGPGGYVLATDLAAGIVELALQVARERGHKQVETRVMDGESLDLPDAAFDAVLCRLGLMYMPHPVTALREWRRAVRPGGRVAVVVFSTPDRNSWGATPLSIIRRRGQLPPPVPGQPGPFSLGEPGVLEGIFRQAGFADPEVRAVPVPLKMASAAEYVQLAREAFGAFNAMMAHLSPRERESVWNEVEESMRSFESPGGFEVPGECLVGAATK